MEVLDFHHFKLSKNMIKYYYRTEREYCIACNVLISEYRFRVYDINRKGVHNISNSHSGCAYCRHP